MAIDFFNPDAQRVSRVASSARMGRRPPPATRQPDLPPGFWETVGAAFKQENVVGSLLSRELGGFRPPDPDFDPFELWDPDAPFDPRENPFRRIAGFESDVAAFVGARDEDDVERIKRNLERERRNRDILSRSPLSVAIPATFGAGVLDPFLAVPVGGQVAAVARGGRGALRAGAATAGIGATFAGVQEGALQGTQDLRTTSESAFNITGATVLSGLLGAGVASLSRGSRLTAVKQLDENGPSAPIDTSRRDPLGPGGLDPSDAPRVESAMGFEHFASRLSPRLAGFTSESPSMRSVTNLLLQAPMRTQGAVNEAPVESMARIAMGRLHRTLALHDDLYARHATGGAQKRATLGRDRILGRMGRTPEGKLTRAQFDEEVAHAARAMGRSEDASAAGGRAFEDFPAEVQEAARLSMRETFAPIGKAMADAGLIDPAVLNRPGYLTRLYDRHKLLDPAERRKLTDALTDWFIREERGRSERAARSIDEPSTFRPDADIRAGARRRAEAAVDDIATIPSGRVWPEGVPRRTPFHERTLNVPDEILAPWLVNDIQTISRFYVRSTVADTEIGARLGLMHARPHLEARRPALARDLHAAEDGATKQRILAEADEALVERLGGGPDMRRYLADSRDETLRSGREPRPMDAILRDRDEALVLDFSSGNLRFARDQVTREYDGLIAEAGTAKQRKALEKARDRDLRNLDLYSADLRGVLDIPNDPTALTPRALAGARQVSFMAMGGMITLSSLPDLFVQALTLGVRNTFRPIRALHNDFQGVKLGRRDARIAGEAAETLTNQRSSTLFELDRGHHQLSRFERGLAGATHAFSIAAGISPWADFMRTFIALTAQGMVGDVALRLARGQKVNAKDLARVRDLGIDDAMARRIGQQYDAHARDATGRVREIAPNVNAWTDEGAKRVFRASMVKARDQGLLRGGPLDRPRLRTPGGATDSPIIAEPFMKVAAQFMNFAAAANTRILGRIAQQRDQTAAGTLLLTVGMGMVATSLKNLAAGREQPEFDQWLVDSVRGSGVSGLVFDIDRYIEAVTVGKVGLSPFTGLRTGNTRFFTPQEMWLAVAGPAPTLVFEGVEGVAGLADEGPTEENVRRLRRILPAQNVFYFRRLLDMLQDQVSTDQRTEE